MRRERAKHGHRQQKCRGDRCAYRSHHGTPTRPSSTSNDKRNCVNAVRSVIMNKRQVRRHLIPQVALLIPRKYIIRVYVVRPDMLDIRIVPQPVELAPFQIVFWPIAVPAVHNSTVRGPFGLVRASIGIVCVGEGSPLAAHDARHQIRICNRGRRLHQPQPILKYKWQLTSMEIPEVDHVVDEETVTEIEHIHESRHIPLGPRRRQ
mmetsp:Transcript_107015/g.301070  ORF Transcript_107015/g.301070 Transcript_107015/m.301070 type:complete len:206 (-) Transcript_107015:1416-2033(-)